jgi:hypothetical protein
MKKIQKIIILLFAIALTIFQFSKNAIAQSASITFERENILVGEQIKMYLKLQIPSGTSNYTFPALETDTLTKHIELIGRSERTDTLQTGKMLELQREFTITSFDSGLHAVPPLPFGIELKSGEEPTIFFSDSAFLDVSLVAVDTSQAIMDIKGPWGIPFQWREYLWILFVVLGILFIAGALLYYYMRRKKGLPLFPMRTVPALPPHTEAIMALDKIKKEKIWRSGLVKDYYTNLTDTLRIYIERRFEIPAPELTSAETIDALQSSQMDNNLCLELNHILQIADMVKFAKGNPASTENENCLEKAYTFVLQTAPSEQEEVNESLHVTNSEKTEKTTEL